jgi:hypothetical protein
MSAFRFTQNPIARAESVIQQRPNSAGVMRRMLGYAWYSILTGMTLGLLVLQIESMRRGDYLPMFTGSGSSVTIIFACLVLIQHFRVMFRTLAVTVGALERERKHEERWETLVMTGISGRAIVLGKWWAIVRACWRDYAWLAFWRTGAVIWLSAELSRASLAVFSALSNNNASVQVEILAPTGVQFLIAMFIIVTLTMLNLLFTVACGIYAGSAFRRGAMLAAVLARLLMIFCLSVGMFVIFCQLSAFTYASSYNAGANSTTISQNVMPDWNNALLGALGSLYDNGSSLAGLFVGYRAYMVDYSSMSPYTTAFLSFVMTTVFYALLTGAALQMAQAQAEKLGALRPREARIVDSR